MGSAPAGSVTAEDRFVPTLVRDPADSSSRDDEVLVEVHGAGSGLMAA